MMYKFQIIRNGKRYWPVWDTILQAESFVRVDQRVTDTPSSHYKIEVLTVQRFK